jgi:hypothetical protein
VIGDAEIVDGVPSEPAANDSGVPASGGYEEPYRIAGASVFATMGALPVRQLETLSAPLPTLAASVIGASAGGAVVGYVAAGDFRGAFTAALMTGGLAGLMDATILWRRQEHKTLGGVVGAFSVLSLLGSWYLATHREP